MRVEMSKIIIKYPPDYDGELHILVNPAGNEVDFQFTIARQENETPWEALVRAAEDIIAQNKRMAG
jgi:hypothetical protein